MLFGLDRGYFIINFCTCPGKSILKSKTRKKGLTLSKSFIVFIDGKCFFVCLFVFLTELVSLLWRCCAQIKFLSADICLNFVSAWRFHFDQ